MICSLLLFDTLFVNIVTVTFGSLVCIELLNVAIEVIYIYIYISSNYYSCIRNTGLFTLEWS